MSYLKITPELKQAVREYHAYHGDKSARVMKVLHDEKGFPALLVHIKNEKGELYTCIDTVDSDGYVSELYSAPRENANEIIAEFEGNGEDYDD